MTGKDRIPIPLRNNHLVHLLDEILEIYKRVAEGFAPFQLLQRILHEVPGLDVAIHADVVEYVLQVTLLLRSEVIALDKLLIDL